MAKPVLNAEAQKGFEELQRIADEANKAENFQRQVEEIERQRQILERKQANMNELKERQALQLEHVSEALPLSLAKKVLAKARKMEATEKYFCPTCGRNCVGTTASRESHLAGHAREEAPKAEQIRVFEDLLSRPSVIQKAVKESR